MKMKKILYIFSLFIILSIRSNAQTGSVANIMSNFGTFKGNLSNVVNPGLQYNDSTSVMFSIPSAFAQFSNNNLSINDINYYFGNEKSKYLTNIDKQNLLTSFKTDGQMNTKISFNLFRMFYSIGYKVGTIGFEINDVIAGNVNLPSQLIELGLAGNQIDRTYTFNNLNAQSSWLRAYALTYANRIFTKEKNSKSIFENIDVGVKLKLIQGFAYAGTESVNSYIYTNQNDNYLKGNYSIQAVSAFSENIGVEYDFDSTYKPQNKFSVFPKPVGSGFGLDLGANIKLSNNLNVSIALNDIGSVKWNKHAVRHNIYGSFYVNDIFNQDQLDSLEESSHSDSYYINDFSTNLPLNFQLGAMLDISKYIRPFRALAFFGNYSQGFNNAPGNSKKPILEAGSYADLGDYLPNAMIAFRYDETQSFRIPFMLGYSFPCFAFNLYGVDMISLFSSNKESPNVSFGLNMYFKIM